MKITFIFPSDYFNQKKTDDFFANEANKILHCGFDHKVVNLNELFSINNLPFDLSDQTIIYRGWMLCKEEYEKLTFLVQNAGGEMLVSLKQYLLTHHLPNWYNYIKDLTAETIIFNYDNNILNSLSKVPWKKFFIKDYVKSLKTSVGSIINNVNLIPVLIEEMKKYRGKIEGGICIRKFEEYVQGTETRFFYIQGSIFGPNQHTLIPSIVQECCSRIIHPFFSIDIAKTAGNEYRIVEIGDGQVSDYIGWDLDRFVNIMKQLT